jgi:hypothetical protein
MPRAAWRQRPNGIFQIDTHAYFADKLLRFYSGDSEFIDCVTYERATRTGSPGFIATTKGTAWNLTGSNYVTFNDSYRTSILQGFTFFWYGTIPTATNGTLFANGAVSANALNWQIAGVTGPKLAVYIKNSSNVIVTAIATTNYSAGTYTIVGVYDGANISLYVNGNYVTQSAQTGNVATAGYVTGLSRMNFGGLSAYHLQAGIANRVWGESEISEWNNNPWQLVAPRPARFILIPDGAGGGSDLAGAASSNATATGALTTQIPIAAAALSVATANSSLITAIPLTGSAAEITVASGVLTAQIQLSGAALAQAAASGTVTTQIRLSGAAIAQALATAGLTASPSGLAGEATAQAAASAGLTTQIPLAGSASAVASSSAALTTAIRLYGVAAQVSAATGDLTVASSTVLDAHALADATAGGSLMTQIKLDAQALATALATGALSSASEWTPNPQRTLRAVIQDRRLPAIRSSRQLTIT